MDCAILICISAFLSFLPAVIVTVNQLLIEHLNTPAATIKTYMHVAIMYVFLLLIRKIVYNFYHHYYLNYHSLLRFEEKLKSSFFQICKDIPLEAYNDARLVNEVRRAQNAGTNLFRVFQIIVEIVCSLAGTFILGEILISINKSLWVYAFVGVLCPFIERIVKQIQMKYKLYGTTQFEKEEETFFDFLSKSQTLKEVKVFDCASVLEQKWIVVVEKLTNIESKTNLRIFIITLLCRLAKIAAIMGAYFNLTWIYLGGKIGLSSFVAALVAFNQISELFNNSLELFGDLSDFLVLVDPYFVFIDKTIKNTDSCSSRNVVPFSDDAVLSLRNVTYQYFGASQKAIDMLNLDIVPGKIIAVVGANGSGKSTLTRLILGLYQPSSGEIFWGSSELSELNVSDYLSAKSLMPQAPNCYYLSVRDNITFSLNPNQERFLASMHAAGLNELSDVNAQIGLEYGGIEFSGGQKQRIALARTIYKNAQFVIFDEPTSAIDPIQESEIYQSLLSYANGRTVIIITHRLSMTRSVDRIIVMDGGHIIEDGNHDQLMKDKKMYYSMWTKQAKLYLEDNF